MEITCSGVNWVSQAQTEYLAGGQSGACNHVIMHEPLFSKVGWHILYLEGKSPVVITVEEESVEDGGEGGVPHVDQEGGQELHHGGELKVKVMWYELM